MTTTHAAVVTAFDRPPRFQVTDVPPVSDPDHQLVDVLAVGLHPRVRSGASGSHYTSTGVLPMIPGVDGVARLPGGDTVFFVADDDLPGPMAEQTVIDLRRTVRLPGGVDVARVAATMNPAMSSWVALRHRVELTPGATVLVLGASGNAGAMAVQVAKRLGAGAVIAVGRDRGRLEEVRDLGADSVVVLADDAAETAEALAAVGGEVDVVIDYLWATPAQQVMTALALGRRDRSALLEWVQIGSVAGPDIDLPSALLRSTNLRILGNGQGAVSTKRYLAELPSLIEEIAAGNLHVDPVVVPLSDIENAWLQPEVRSQRLVVVP